VRVKWWWNWDLVYYRRRYCSRCFHRRNSRNNRQTSRRHCPRFRRHIRRMRDLKNRSTKIYRQNFFDQYWSTKKWSKLIDKSLVINYLKMHMLCSIVITWSKQKLESFYSFYLNFAKILFYKRNVQLKPSCRSQMLLFKPTKCVLGRSLKTPISFLCQEHII